MGEDAEKRYLETLRRVYMEGDYGTERGQRTLERKARVLEIDAEQIAPIAERQIRNYDEYKECLLDFLADGPLTDNQQAEAEELRIDLDLTEEEANGILALVQGTPNADTTTPPTTNSPGPDTYANASTLANESSFPQGATDTEDDDDEDAVTQNNAAIKLQTAGGFRFVEVGVPAANDWVYYDLMSEFGNIREQFTQGYRRFGSLEAVVQGIDDLFISQLVEFSESVLDFLRRLDVLHYSSTDIVQGAFEISGHLFESAKDEVYDFLEAIEDSTAMKDAYRSARRQSRGKFAGFGAKGMMEAGAANMAIGTVHGVFNLIGKGITAAGNAAKKSSKYKQMEDPFTDALFGMCEAMYDFTSSILSDEGIACDTSDEISDRRQRANTMLENAVEAGYDRSKMMDVAIRSLQMYSHTNHEAIFMMLTLSIDTKAQSLAQNFNNLTSISNFANNYMFVGRRDYRELDKVYLMLAEQAVFSGLPDETVRMALASLDADMFWNADRHADLKEEFHYRYPENQFITSSAKVPGSIGSAFVDKAFSGYQSLPQKPFGDKFLTAQDARFSDKFVNAVQSYGQEFSDSETPVFLYDDTLMGSAKSGFFITDKHVYGKGIKRIRLDEVESITFSKTAGVDYIRWNNTDKLALTMLSNVDTFKSFLTYLFPQASSAAPLTASASAPVIEERQESGTTASQGADSMDSQGQSPHNPSGATPGAAGMTKEQAFERILGEFGGTSGSSIKDKVFVLRGSAKSGEKFGKARSTYATGLAQGEMPVVCYDNTAFGSGKEGFLITDQRIYGKNMFEKPWSMSLSDITSIELKKSDLLFNGQRADIVLISSKEREEFAEFVRSAVQALVERN